LARHGEQSTEIQSNSSDSLLIYASHNGSYLSSGDEVQFNDNLALPFEAGKTYRLRVVKWVDRLHSAAKTPDGLTEGLRSAGIFAMTFFWIDGHDMRIIEVDGVRVTAFSRRGLLDSW
jgi:iron transport multicopper oxidase